MGGSPIAWGRGTGLFLGDDAVGNDEFVALAVYVVDFDGGVGREMLAELCDVDIHGACVEVVVVDPDGLEREFAQQHIVGMGAEESEEFALLGGEFGLLVADAEYLALCVELELAEFVERDDGFLSLDATQYDPVWIKTSISCRQCINNT